jgi:CBS domain containing-hemolysin-like protein
VSRPDIWAIVLAVVLLFLAALLAGADAALSRMSRVSVEALAREGRKGTAHLQAVMADPPRYLNVVLFLRTFFSVTATVLVARVFLDLVHPTWWALVAAAVVMAIAEYVFVGVSPRTLGRQHADRFSLFIARPVHALGTVLWPLARLLIVIGNALTPGKGFRDGPFTSEAELRDLVDLAEERRLIEDEERQMIHSVFELGDTIVREVMVPRTDVVFVEKNKTLRQALSLALRAGFSRIPVVGESVDDVAGIVYLKDLARRVYEHRSAETSERVESLMRPATFVPDSKPVDELLREMQLMHIHMAVVVDEYGGTAGLVTIEDILEEIVGEIADEYDTERPEVEHLPDGSVRVSARLQVEDLAELFHVEIDDDDVDTVGGLLAKRLGKVPIAGAHVEVAGLSLTAESLEGRRNRVGTVLVRRLPEPAADGEAVPSNESAEHADA